MSLHPQLQSSCRTDEALEAFAQDAYHCSLAYGPQDVRSSLAYYNLAKVFQGMQELDKTLACCDQVGHCLSLLGCAHRLRECCMAFRVFSILTYALHVLQKDVV